MARRGPGRPFLRRLSDAAIAEARRLAADGRPQSEIKELTGVSRRYVSDLARGIGRLDAPGPILPAITPAERERRRLDAHMAKHGKVAPDWSTVAGRLGVVPDSIIARELRITQSAVLQRRRREAIADPVPMKRGRRPARRRSKVGGTRPPEVPARGRGRPPLDPAIKRGAPISVRATPEQAERIDAAAKAAGMSRSDWLLAAAELAMGTPMA